MKVRLCVQISDRSPNSASSCLLNPAWLNLQEVAAKKNEVEPIQQHTLWTKGRKTQAKCKIVLVISWVLLNSVTSMQLFLLDNSHKNAWMDMFLCVSLLHISIDEERNVQFTSSDLWLNNKRYLVWLFFVPFDLTSRQSRYTPSRVQPVAATGR